MTGSDRIHSHSFTVPADAIDENGHVNNVVYVQWMQKQARAILEDVSTVFDIEREK